MTLEYSITFREYGVNAFVQTCMASAYSRMRFTLQHHKYMYAWIDLYPSLFAA